MATRGGAIVNISDLAGLETWTDYIPHGISKSGVVQMTRALAHALAPHIRVNAIAPGAVLSAKGTGMRPRRRISWRRPRCAGSGSRGRASGPCCISYRPTTSPVRPSSSTADAMSASDQRNLLDAAGSLSVDSVWSASAWRARAGRSRRRAADLRDDRRRRRGLLRQLLRPSTRAGAGGWRADVEPRCGRRSRSVVRGRSRLAGGGDHGARGGTRDQWTGICSSRIIWMPPVWIPTRRGRRHRPVAAHAAPHVRVDTGARRGTGHTAW